MRHLITALTLIMALPFASVAWASPAFTLVIKNHQFQPAVLEIPAGERVRLTVRNQDATPEEFESYSLNREKVIAGNSTGVVFVGPLDAGEYDFFGDFNPDTAKGKLIAK
ncbi:MAG: cupredoxin domain-containing protein [Alcanivorax sp.]|nr:cupredoxin domain-containing protein [Alcanivorax sp.]